MIRKLLKAKYPKDRDRVNEIFDSLPSELNIAWYPSAGDDFQDLIELSKFGEPVSGMNKLPNLFIHTDYSNTAAEFFKKGNGTLRDDNLRIRVNFIAQLSIKPEFKIHYNINPDFINDSNNKINTAKIYLYHFAISQNSSVVRLPLIYFSFENINFLEEVLLKHKIEISHLIKVREGFYAKSISIAYAFLSDLNTRYLLIDHIVDIDLNLGNKIANNRNIVLNNYRLEKLKTIINWAESYNVTIFKVKHLNSALNLNELQNKFLNILNE